jgi:hypothetical protein
MRANLGVVVLFLLIFLLFFLATILLIAWAILLGWLLTLIQPLGFTLFEGSLLGLLATITIGVATYRLLTARVPSFDPTEEDEADWDDEDENYPIPSTRFYKSEEDKTYEAWYRYEVANAIFLEFQDDPEVSGIMGDPQLQELAIRLAAISVAALKRKQRHPVNVSVSVQAMKNEMEKMGQRPYDEGILRAAVRGVNETLSADPELSQIPRQKLWAMALPYWRDL